VPCHLATPQGTDDSLFAGTSAIHGDYTGPFTGYQLSGFADYQPTLLTFEYHYPTWYRLTNFDEGS
jgi:hypothetical protein